MNIIGELRKCTKIKLKKKIYNGICITELEEVIKNINICGSY